MGQADQHDAGGQGQGGGHGVDPATQEGLGTAVDIQADLALDLHVGDALDPRGLDLSLGHDPRSLGLGLGTHRVSPGLQMGLVGHLRIPAQVGQLLAALLTAAFEIGIDLLILGRSAVLAGPGCHGPPLAP